LDFVKDKLPGHNISQVRVQGHQPILVSLSPADFQIAEFFSYISGLKPCQLTGPEAGVIEGFQYSKVSRLLLGTKVRPHLQMNNGVDAGEGPDFPPEARPVSAGLPFAAGSFPPSGSSRGSSLTSASTFSFGPANYQAKGLAKRSPW